MNKKESPAQAVNELRVVMINDRRFAVEERNGNISFNLTMMAKPFGRQNSPGNWLRTEESKRYLKAFAVMRKCDTADLLEVRQGGTPEKQGTWATDYRIAMRFAQWLDPDFAIAVDELVFNVLTRQAAVAHAPLKYGVSAVIHDGMPLYPYADIVRALGGSARGGTQWRRAKFPQHFRKLFGRNFITPQYADLLASYYSYRQAQLSLDFGLSEKGGAQ